MTLCKADRREYLISTLNDLHNLHAQVNEDISSTEAELKRLDATAKIRSDALSMGATLKAWTDGFEEAGFTEDQAFDLVLALIGSINMEVTLTA